MIQILIIIQKKNMIKYFKKKIKKLKHLIKKQL